MIEAVNASGVPILAVDLPSGIDGATGAVHGRRGQGRADGHLLPPEARPSAAAGPAPLRRDASSPTSASMPVLDTIRPTTFHNVPALWRSAFPLPRHDGHKYDRGHAVVVSGPACATGAARLAARGALRVGAGLVTSPRRPTRSPSTPRTSPVMVRPMDGAAGLAAILADRAAERGRRSARASASASRRCELVDGGACRRARRGSRRRRAHLFRRRAGRACSQRSAARHRRTVVSRRMTASSRASFRSS